MDPCAVFTLTFGTAIVAGRNAAVMEQYAARVRYAQPVVAQPAWEPAPVACVPVAPAAAPRSSPAASRAFQDHWQNFMQPSVRRPAGAPPASVPGWGR